MRIKDSLEKEGNLELEGWVDELRDLGGIIFISLRDESGKIQITLPEKKVDKDIFEKASEEISKEDYIEVSGKIKENEEAPNDKEIIPKKLNVISKSDSLPIELSDEINTSLSKRIDWRFVDLKKGKNQKVFQLQNEIVKFIEDYLEKKNFLRIFSSKLIKTPTEGGTEYFPIEYFEKEAYLAQSPQFYKECSLLSNKKVYEVGHVYRAEPHHTSRHICEYVSIDLEMVTRDMESLLEFEEKMLRDLFNYLNKECKEILEEWDIDKLNFPEKIPIITLDEANEILKEMDVETEEGDLTSEGEKALGRWVKENKDSDFVFLTKYPWREKVFYAKRMENEPKYAYSFDLLYKGVEITTGGLREENYEKRRENAKEFGLDPEKFEHMKFFKYGMPPHGGLAIGLERLTQHILSMENVREAALTPRDPERITP